MDLIIKDVGKLSYRRDNQDRDCFGITPQQLYRDVTTDTECQFIFNIGVELEFQPRRNDSLVNVFQEQLDRGSDMNGEVMYLGRGLTKIEAFWSNAEVATKKSSDSVSLMNDLAFLIEQVAPLGTERVFDEVLGAEYMLPLARYRPGTSVSHGWAPIAHYDASMQMLRDEQKRYNLKVDWRTINRAGWYQGTHINIDTPATTQEGILLMDCLYLITPWLYHGTRIHFDRPTNTRIGTYNKSWAHPRRIPQRLWQHRTKDGLAENLNWPVGVRKQDDGTYIADLTTTYTLEDNIKTLWWFVRPKRNQDGESYIEYRPIMSLKPEELEQFVRMFDDVLRQIWDVIAKTSKDADEVYKLVFLALNERFSGAFPIVPPDEAEWLLALTDWEAYVKKYKAS